LSIFVAKNSSSYTGFEGNIYYHPDADPSVIERIKYLSNFKKVGAGILAMPNCVVTASTEVVTTAWTPTMKLGTFEEEKLVTFINEYITRGPEKIPAISIRRRYNVIVIGIDRLERRILLRHDQGKNWVDFDDIIKIIE
jgi:hypothetical protein